ncbi:hypothetical protein NOCARDAX2BIS_460005 [Nocardioides sp. AX2bis]|nr:hypothetical protein NOCARDAX2BIS_460005 [Nocardioides sp. AX2bis]
MARRARRRARGARHDRRGTSRRRPRRLRLGAQRDLDRGDGAGGPPARHPGRGGAGRRRRDLGRRRAAGRRGRVRRLLLRPAEGLRLRRRAVVRADVAGGPGPGRRDRRHRPARAGLAGPGHRRRPVGQAADLQHPGRRDAVPDGRAAGLDARPRRAAGRGRADDAVVVRAVRLGGGVVVRHPVRHRPGPPLAGGRHGRPGRVGGRGAGLGRAAGPRRGGHRAVPQARPQPAARGDVPRRRPRGRRRPDPLHRPRGRAPVADGGGIPQEVCRPPVRARRVDGPARRGAGLRRAP